MSPRVALVTCSELPQLGEDEPLLLHALRARKIDAEPAAVEAQDTSAEGIAIPRPPRGAQILAAVRASGGCFVEVPEAAVSPAQTELASRGLFVEPTAALTWATALIARDALADVPASGDGWDRARELAAGSVVVPLCGSGLKSK